MVTVFLDDNKTNDIGDGKENGKNNMLIEFAPAHAISYISLPSLHHYDMKFPNFTSPLCVVGEHNTKIVAFFF